MNAKTMNAKTGSPRINRRAATQQARIVLGRMGGSGRKPLEIITPEGVPVSFEIASLGDRFSAQLLDILFTMLAAGLLILGLVMTDALSYATLGAIFSLLWLLIGLPYYMICELLMNGRTLGKRLLGIRVLARDGAGLSAHAVVTRNLTRQVEVFIPLALLAGFSRDTPVNQLISIGWLLAVLLVLWRSRLNQRIGDFAAGTVVVVQPRAVLMPDLSTAKVTATAARFSFTSAQLDLYGAYELQVLERLLRSGDTRGDAALSRAHLDRLGEVGSRIRKKIGLDEVVLLSEEEDFLQAFYTAQRAYLEQKKLFGDARLNKFHGADTPAPAGKPGTGTDPGPNSGPNSGANPNPGRRPMPPRPGQ